MTAPTPIDLADPNTYVDGVPHAAFHSLREKDPVSWQEESGGSGFWAVTRHADVVHVSKNPRIFSSALAATNITEPAADELEILRSLLINMDPPRHVKFRRLVRSGFTPSRVQLLRRRVQEQARELVEALIQKGECDFVTEVAAELPMRVISELLGVPEQDRPKIFDLSNRLIGFDDPEFQNSPEDGKQAAAEMWLYAHQLASERRGGDGDDLLSVLLRAEVDGERLTEPEVDNFFLLLAVAGNETTRNLISGAMQALIEHPDQWERLRRDRSLLASGVEEFLRWVTPVMHFRRTAAEDTVLSGRRISEGDKVVMFYSSANRDAAVFENPDCFDVSRSPNPHLALGIGEHYCLGANLARLEIAAVFDELLRNVHRLESGGPARRLRSSFIAGIKSMPVRVLLED
jgi:cholest-4-en-3-one 26-monooxygenase